MQIPPKAPGRCTARLRCFYLVLLLSALCAAPPPVRATGTVGRAQTPSASAAVALPVGWKERKTKQAGARAFYPGDLETGEMAVLVVLPAAPVAAGDVETWLTERVARANAGKTAQMEPTQRKGAVVFAQGRVDGQRRLFLARHDADRNTARLFVFSASSDAVFVRYLSGAETVISALGSAQTFAAAPPPVPKPNTNTAGKPRAPEAAPARRAGKTIPAGPLPAASLNGARVFVKYAQDPFSGARFDHLILFPDGTAFDDVPSDPLPRFDAATLRKMLKARAVGTWKQAGNTLVLSFPNAGEPRRMLKKHPRGWYDGNDALPEAKSTYDIYFPVIFPPRQALLGPWKNRSLTTTGMAGGGGGAPMVAAGGTGDYVFRADGTFSSSEKRFASATTTNRGDVFKSGGDVGAYSSKQNGAAGRWRLDGPLLTLATSDGTRTVRLAFRLPHWDSDNSPDLLVGGDWWRRPNDD